MNPRTRASSCAKSIGALVLSHNNIMTHLLQVLSNLQSISDDGAILGLDIDHVDCASTRSDDPKSVGDVVFKILCTLNVKALDVIDMVKPLYEHLASPSLGTTSTHRPMFLFTIVFD